MRVLGLALLAACAFACSGKPAPAAANQPTPPAPIVISIVSTNDVHGHIEQLPLLGGYLRNLRAARARDHGAVLLLDAGDMLQGTLESNLGEGAATIRAFNALGCAAATIGNHEFDFGPVGPHPIPIAEGENPLGALTARIGESHFPWLSANLVAKPSASGERVLPAELRASTLLDLAGIQVGVVGGITRDALTATQTKNVAALALTSLPDSIAREAQSLRARGAKLVIALVHAGGACRAFGNPDDLSSCEADSEVFELARALPKGAVDLIVAGHTHDGIAQRVAGIPIVEAFSNGRAFARVDVSIDPQSGRVLSQIDPPHALCTEQLDRPCCAHESYEGAAVQRDAAVAQAIAPDLARAEAERARPIGVEISHALERSAKLESPLSNLLVDLVRGAVPNADAAVNNGGSIRTAMPAGALRYGQLFELFPFDNAIASVQMRGEELAAMIRNNLTSDHGFLSLSGLRASARCKGDTLEVELVRASGKRVARKESLRVAMSDFLASGGDGLLRRIRLGADAIHVDHARMLRDAFAEELAVRKRIDADDPKLFDPKHPRVRFSGTRPLHCP